MRSFSLALLLCLLFAACNNQKKEDNPADNNKTASKSAAADSETTTPPPTNMNFPYLVVKAKDLAALKTKYGNYKRIIFNLYPDAESSQANTFRLVALLVDASRDTIADPLFDLLKIQPNNSSNNYPPLQVSSKIYFTQYELTNRQVRLLLNGKNGNEDIILRPEAPAAGTYYIGYSVACNLCLTEDILPPCPPFVPQSHE